MPLGIVSDDQFEVEIERIQHGRAPGLKNIPSGVRALIAESAIKEEGRIIDIADAYKVSPSTVSALKHDATSTASYNQPNKELEKKNDEVRDELQVKVRAKLLNALDEITPDKLKSARIKDIAGVARDMATVMKEFSPGSVNGQRVNVVIYKPRMREEDEFEVITVNE